MSPYITEAVIALGSLSVVLICALELAIRWSERRAEKRSRRDYWRPIIRRLETGS